MEEPKDRKVHTCAVIIMPPKEQWEQIQEIRSKHDKAFERWMPHINMVYPFVPESEFEAAAATLTEAMRDVAPFDVSLAAFDHFSHSKTSKTIYLKPDAHGSLAIRKVHAKLEGAFPHCTDLSSKSALGFQPHLTLAQAQSADGCDKMIQSFFKGWRPVQWTVSELYVISRPDDTTPFSIKHTIKLGGAKGEAEPEEKEKKEQPVSFYQIAGNDLRINCTWEEDACETAAQQSATKILLVIDISGSMCTELESVKAAVRYMLNNGITKPDVIVYSVTARFCTAEQMLTCKSEGGTSFEAALNKITEFVKQCKPNEKVSCIFMTDGEDTGSQNLNKAKADFKTHLSDCAQDVVMHTIGFGKSHCRALLAELAKLGKREGVYRYAEGKGTLDAKFSELFDFIEMNIKRTLLVNGQPVSVDAERGPSGELTVDAFLRLDQVDPERKLFNNGACTITMAEGASVTLQFVEPDAFFALKRIEETPITEQHHLQKLQAQIAEISLGKVPRSQRNKFLEQKATVQAKLDQYHAVFAEVARGTIKGDNLAAQLLSLRHETKFANARRARVMAQRAQANAGAMKQIESKLKQLKPNLEKFKAMDLTCPLSGTTISEAMAETNNDFFCFALRVTRPEHAVEAPTQLSVQKVLVGTYSNEAFVQASKFAVQSVGGAQAHGGFAVPNAQVAPEVGLFKGPDGERMNACLPLYINEDHWARVQVQIKPVLGYFFTLDPLGFRGDQYIALFCILGHMLCQRASGLFVSEWADWLIADFAKLCNAVKPLALHYLKSGGYGGRIRGDILEDFLAGPLDRTKDALQNLMVVVGWEYGTGVATAPATAERFHAAFVEELWRRNLSTAYHAAPPQMANETLEKLLVEPMEGDVSAEGALGAEGGERHANKPQKEREFEEFAKFKFGKLSKAKQAEAEKAWGAKGPEIEGLLPETFGFQSCKLVKYEEHAARLDKLVEEELGKIKAANEYVAALYSQRPLGAGFSGKMKWLMLVQALRFHTNSAANSGVTSGAYKNTFDNTEDEKLAALMKDLYDEFERKRKESWTAVVRGRNETLTARRIASTKDLHAFCGRLMLSCPTRGGPVFDALMALLCTGQVNGERIPLLAEKIRTIMTGRTRFSEDVDEKVMSNGESYIHLNPETAKRLSEVLGKEQWARIESEMIGTWGWVYRVSDIPNRHGHNNSNPNPLLRKAFSGFKFN